MIITERNQVNEEQQGGFGGSNQTPRLALTSTRHPMGFASRIVRRQSMCERLRTSQGSDAS
ncbi:hypothetical protein ACRALDRAFT_1065871 [Sodiomyces alcalophilus JCM 7366]|uniref:uncharacterized protein n=1 Tax=Sodiomyces alcalophilus JCM 7366 TaxID=591952 RepID=UPI0039B40214